MITSLTILAQGIWTIEQSFTIPGKASGLAWDGTYLYYGIYGSGGSNFYRFNPATTGFLVWDFITAGTSVWSLALMDYLNNDGKPELAAGTYNGVSYIFDAAN